MNVHTIPKESIIVYRVVTSSKLFLGRGSTTTTSIESNQLRFHVSHKLSPLRCVMKAWASACCIYQQVKTSLNGGCSKGPLWDG